MSKKHGLCCISIGTALLIAALSLVLYNLNENKKSGGSAHEVLLELKNVIPTPTDAIENREEHDFYAEFDSEAEPATEESTMIVDDHGYIGIISIPSLEIELPVMFDWSYPNLKISPCRYKGTAADGDMIIAAHNYRSHFGRLRELSGGEEIVFTDVNGKSTRYEVLYTVEINGKDVEEMEFGSADTWDLTLFTCTLGGQSRVTVRATEIADN